MYDVIGGPPGRSSGRGGRSFPRMSILLDAIHGRGRPVRPGGATCVEQVVYSIYHMVLYSLPEGDGWVGCW